MMASEYDIETINYEEQALSRVAQQFQNLERFEAVIKLYAEIAQDLEADIKNLFDLSDIDKMGGKNLDVIGEIVGQPRVLVNADFVEFFGYEGAPNAQSYGDLNNDATGGRYRSLQEAEAGNIKVSDPEYRILIKARILKNNSNCTPEEVLESLRLLFSTEYASISEGRMSMTLGVGKDIGATEEYLLKEYDLIPRASGIRIDEYIKYDGETGAFSYEGGGGLGYDDFFNPVRAGRYASLLGGEFAAGRGFSEGFDSGFGGGSGSGELDVGEITYYNDFFSEDGLNLTKWEIETLEGNYDVSDGLLKLTPNDDDIILVSKAPVADEAGAWSVEYEFANLNIDPRTQSWLALSLFFAGGGSDDKMSVYRYGTGWGADLLEFNGRINSSQKTVYSQPNSLTEGKYKLSYDPSGSGTLEAFFNGASLGTVDCEGLVIDSVKIWTRSAQQTFTAEVDNFIFRKL